MVSNGTLKLIVKNDNPTWKGVQKPFSSGMIHSKLDIYRFDRGKFEIRCKIPSGAGLWPSFWLFGSGREIDAFEFRRGSTSHVEMSLHKWLPDKSTNTLPVSIDGIDYSQDFHTFTVEWDKNLIRWIIDGNEVYHVFRLYHNTAGVRTDNCYVSGGHYLQYKWFPSNGVEQLPVNVIAGVGTEGGAFAPPTSGFSQKQMEIDYIRVYQREPEVWFPPLCASLNGSDLICIDQNKSFNVLEDFGSITWSVSPNLDIISQNNTTVTVHSKQGITYGDAWVRANFGQNSMCGVTSATKNIWIGKPDQITVVKSVVACRNAFQIHASNDPNAKATYSWNVGNGQFSNADYAPTLPFDIPFTVTASNSCGSQFFSDHIQSIDDAFCPPFRVALPA